MGDSLVDLLNPLCSGLKFLEQDPIKVMKNNWAIENCLCHVSPSHWPIDKPYRLVELHKGSVEYNDIERSFKSTFHHYSAGKQITIQRVENPFLYVQYQLKLKQKQNMFQFVSEHRLFHGTKDCNIESICEGNFDWRKMGCNGFRFSKYGCGISFSPSACYASDYPRCYFTSMRIMFVAKVMEVSRCPGESNLTIPPYPHDTSAGGSVVVKYFDNEFYPEYIIRYPPM